jgi:AcrR family transcriptional regulator
VKNIKSTVGSRKAGTRDLLISAAIKCLAEVGYAGATMRLVSDVAGVTQGPRQYYFPTPVKLYEAVVDRIQTGADDWFEDVRAKVEGCSPEEIIRAVVIPAFRNCGSDNHLSMIELKLACRGNPALRAAIEKKIVEYETRNDQVWVDLLGETGLSETELVEIRTVVAAALRGWGVAIASGGKRKHSPIVGETLIQLILARIPERA